MKYYCIDAQSREALRDSDGQWLTGEARRFPHPPGSKTEEELPYAIPANAVINAPIESVKNNETIVAVKLNMDANGYMTATWQRIADHRGEVWFDRTGQMVMISQLGDPSSLGLFTSNPVLGNGDRSTNYDVQQNAGFSENLEQRKTIKPLSWWQRLLNRGGGKSP